MKKILYYLALILGWMFIYVVFNVFIFQDSSSGIFIIYLKYALIVFLCSLYQGFLPKFHVKEDAKEEEKTSEE